jgi:single-strand DNA-binding protein
MFSVAVNRGRRGQDGQRTEVTDWFRVVCWNKLAETADQYLKKGQRVYVEGRLQIRKYTGNDGAERTAVEVIANDMVTLSERADTSERMAAPANGKKSRTEPFGKIDELDDLPF